MTTTCRAPTEIPGFVQQANALAARMPFAESCIDAVGPLLRLLASQYRDGVIAEIGTGCG